jgi:hypothetical protein
VKFLKTMADNALKHNYSMMQIKKKEQWENVAVIQAYTLKYPSQDHTHSLQDISKRKTNRRCNIIKIDQVCKS